MILFEVKITRKPTIIFILLSIFISLGCTQRVQLYDGPPRYGKVATLFEIPIDTNLEVDGKPVKWDKTDKAVRADGSMVPYGFVHVELLPGRHTIEWSRDRHDVNFTFEGLGILNAKAGKYYKMRFATLKGKQIKMNRSTKRNFGIGVAVNSTWRFLLCQSRIF